MRRWVDRVRLRLRSLLHGAMQVDAELQREFQQHLEEADRREHRVGHDARTKRGPRRCARSVRWRASARSAATPGGSRPCIQNLMQDLRYTLRSLAQQPLLLVAATLSIAVAVGANTTIFNLASQLLLATPSASPPGSPRRPSAWALAATCPTAQWQDLERSRALAGLAGYQIEAEVNWRGRRAGREPDAADRHREFLRRARRAAGDGTRIHRRRRRRPSGIPPWRSSATGSGHGGWAAIPSVLGNRS